MVKAEQGIDDPEVQERFEQLMQRSPTRSRASPSTPDPDLCRTARSPSPSSTSPTAPFEELVDDGKDIRDDGDELPPIEGVKIEYGGDLFSEFELPESEIYGILAAVIILIIAFGSVLAMGLPIGTALFGLGIATALVTLLSNPIAMPDFTTAMVAMIGIGVGIDYALFIVTRYREALHAGLTPRTRSPRRSTPVAGR